VITTKSNRVPVAGKEGKSMRNYLACAAALAAAALASQAAAEIYSSSDVTINSSVPRYCQGAISTTAQDMALGSLIDTNGFLVSTFGGTATKTLTGTGSYYCNAPSTLTLRAKPLLPNPSVTVTDTQSFAAQVDYVASLTWGAGVTASASSTAPSATSVPTNVAHTGAIALSLATPTTPNNRRPVAANYEGSVTITVALQP